MINRIWENKSFPKFQRGGFKRQVSKSVRRAQHQIPFINQAHVISEYNGGFQTILLGRTAADMNSGDTFVAL